MINRYPSKKGTHIDVYITILILKPKLLTLYLYIDKIIFPEELCMMLNAKIQVAHNLKKEFQNIIDSQPDSFSA
jgi:hypothetical protein